MTMRELHEYCIHYGIAAEIDGDHMCAKVFLPEGDSLLIWLK